MKGSLAVENYSSDPFLFVILSRVAAFLQHRGGSMSHIQCIDFAGV